MGIAIKHLEGPLAGKEQYFDDSFDAVLFGRDREMAQVVYPPEYTMVGRGHFELRRCPNGEYTVELFGTRYVEIDGQPAHNGQPVRSGSTFRLGREGPSFEVEITIENAQGLPTTGMPKRQSMPQSVRRGWNITDALSEVVSDVAEVVVGAARTAGKGAAHAKEAFNSALRKKNIAASASPEGLTAKRSEAEAPPVGLSERRHGETDLVDLSVFGPKDLPAGGEALIQVFLHQLDQRELAKALAEETDPDATRRGVQTLAAVIERGQHVTIMLEGRGLTVDQEMQSLVWRGEPCPCQFTVTAPENSIGSTFHPRVLVLVNSVPIGSITFALKVAAHAEQREIELRGDRARRYAYAFLSYASPDRAEVLKRAQGMKAGGTDFFNDLLSLEPGERWEQRLYREIDRCDVFYLFWSSQAKASEWVLKETEYALARRASSGEERPDIVPVIIEGPPPPEPPDALRELHFNDCLLYVLAATESGSRTSA